MDPDQPKSLHLDSGGHRLRMQKESGQAACKLWRSFNNTYMLRNCKISKNQDQRRAQIFCVWRIRIRLLKTFESTCFLSCGKYLNMSHVFTSNNLISEKCKKENNLCKIVGSIFKPVNSYGI